jgi:hypothetical protein
LHKEWSTWLQKDLSTEIWQQGTACEYWGMALSTGEFGTNIAAKPKVLPETKITLHSTHTHTYPSSFFDMANATQCCLFDTLWNVPKHEWVSVLLRNLLGVWS